MKTGTSLDPSRPHPPRQRICYAIYGQHSGITQRSKAWRQRRKLFAFSSAVLFVFGSAKYCTYDRHCYWSGESCCSDNVCRDYCSFWSGGVIAATTTSTIVFFAIVICIVSCCCCSCCPCYHYRSPSGTVGIMPQPANQLFVTRTQRTAILSMQQYPPPGPYLNQPPPGYAEPPSKYPSYPQIPGQYPPPQAQGQPPVPPPASAEEPINS